MLAVAAAPRVVAVAFSLPAFAPEAAVFVATGACLAKSATFAPGAAALNEFPCDDDSTPVAFSAPIEASMLRPARFTTTCVGVGGMLENAVNEMPDSDAGARKTMRHARCGVTTHLQETRKVALRRDAQSPTAEVSVWAF